MSSARYTPPTWRAWLAASRPLSGGWCTFETPLSLAGAGLLLTSCADFLAQEEDTPSLEQQQEQGWNVGTESTPLLLLGTTDYDSDGSQSWRRRMTDLSERMSPRSVRWAPYYAPTLFQSLQNSQNESLRASLRPMFTPAMEEAFRQGRAMAGLFAGSRGCRADVAVVLDAEGPESVAAAAGMSVCLEPVFFFDNWPHPAGVVPSHLTIAAVLYFAPLFERMQINRPHGLAPLFVLDHRRLDPYIDEASRFDNRYVARMPTAGALAAAGIRHLLYVTSSLHTRHELDDLNQDFVGMTQAGIEVRMVALQAFAPEQARESADLPSTLDGTISDETSAGESARFFGGSRLLNALFWSWYGWPDQNGQIRTLSTINENGPIPQLLFTAWSYRPVDRPTMFSQQTWADPNAPLPQFQFGTGIGHGSGHFLFGGGRSGTLGRMGGGHGA